MVISASARSLLTILNIITNIAILIITSDAIITLRCSIRIICIIYIYIINYTYILVIILCTVLSHLQTCLYINVIDFISWPMQNEYLEIMCTYIKIIITR